LGQHNFIIIGQTVKRNSKKRSWRDAGGELHFSAVKVGLCLRGNEKGLLKCRCGDQKEVQKKNLSTNGG